MCLSQSAVFGSPPSGPVFTGNRASLPIEAGGNYVPLTVPIKALLCCGAFHLKWELFNVVCTGNGPSQCSKNPLAQPDPDRPLVRSCFRP